MYSHLHTNQDDLIVVNATRLGMTSLLAHLFFPLSLPVLSSKSITSITQFKSIYPPDTVRRHEACKYLFCIIIITTADA